MALVRTDGRHLCNRQKTMSNQLVFIGLGDRTPLNWLVPPIHPLDGRLKAAPKSRRKSIDGRVLCRQSWLALAFCRLLFVGQTLLSACRFPSSSSAAHENDHLAPLPCEQPTYREPRRRSCFPWRQIVVEDQLRPSALLAPDGI